MDKSHIAALCLRASHERARLADENTDAGKALRTVWVKQIEKEIADERARLGMPVEVAVSDLTDEELIAELTA